MSTEVTLYPASAGSDGYARENYPQWQGKTWATLRGNPGNDSDWGGTYMFLAQILCDASGYDDLWRAITRSIVSFDTSSLPDSCTILSAVLSLYGYAVAVAADVADTCVYSSSPASPVGVVDGDFDSLGSVEFSNTIAIGDFSTVGYNAFTLNAAGIAHISKTGYTSFGFKEVTHDADGATPTWTAGASGYIAAYTSEQGDGYKPKLEVTYTTAPIFPSDAITRVTNLIHRYNRAEGSYTLEMALGEVTSDFGLPQWLSKPQDTVPVDPLTALNKLLKKEGWLEARTGEEWRKILEAQPVTQYTDEQIRAAFRAGTMTVTQQKQGIDRGIIPSTREAATGNIQEIMDKYGLRELFGEEK